jgi:hypothetical protein
MLVLPVSSWHIASIIASTVMHGPVAGHFNAGRVCEDRVIPLIPRPDAGKIRKNLS